MENSIKKKLVFFLPLFVLLISLSCSKDLPTEPDMKFGQLIVSIQFPDKTSKELNKTADVDRIEIQLYQGST